MAGPGVRVWLDEGPSGVDVRFKTSTGPEKRVRPLGPVDSEEPADVSLIGDYYSAELGAWYRIEGDESGLFLWNRKHGRSPLLRGARDLYRGGGFAGLTVERAADGEVRGFTVSSGRVWKVRFERRARLEAVPR